MGLFGRRKSGMEFGLNRALKIVGTDSPMGQQIQSLTEQMSAENAQAHDPEHARLLEHGAQGLGVVISHETIAVNQFGGENRYTIRVRFRFDDGTTTEFDCPWVSRAEVGDLNVGDKVPVRYDAEQHTAALDTAAVEAQRAQQADAVKSRQRQIDEEKIAKAEAEIESRQ
jgi:hypothetical protein